MLTVWRYFETESTQKSPHCGPPTLPEKLPLRIVNRSLLACIGTLARGDNTNDGGCYGIHVTMVIPSGTVHNSVWFGIADGFASGFSSFTSNKRTGNLS
jgi:hypothetical protein